ncbi:hypothetical protein N7491_004789 [Penicillium cf. griseofulvum]|uniref:Cation transporter n=1 Tax=Penicillium cf. griseofulvum TaxID=2972120 RepID=A0A9W9J2B3_9EURO|nr:hypothetical protein N7472_007478 [Penicillium cf. griseofulvum]KAJ5434194.1 hypothetical protein N7491_004789 [Penicillium cf. griseofulvum]KAJ5452019.1 hypothetical protein N7445_000202 [Penicillium cf. griseofulvum]
MVWDVPALHSDNAYDSHSSMPIMADLLEFNPLTLHYAYFISTSFIGSIIFYTAPSPIHDLQYPDALFMCFSAMTGTGLGVMDLSPLSTLQQGTLFVLLILGHAFPIFAAISLLRAWKIRSALKDTPDKEKERQTVSRMPTLQIGKKQMAYVEEGTLSANVIGKAKIANVVKEVQSDISSLCEPEGSWKKYGIVIVTDRKDLGDGKAYIPSMNSWLKNHFSCRDSINSNGQAEAEYRALEYRAILLTALLTMLYFIGFLIIGIVSIGLWSEFVRPDIPREDETSPFWAGAFLATSALCNNGMSLIDTNMSPYQKESFPLLTCGVLILAGNTLSPCLLRLFIWILRKMLPNKSTWQLWRRTFDFALDQSQKISAYLYPTWHTWFLLGTVLVFNAIMWGAFEVAAIRNEEIASLTSKFRVLDGLFQALAVRGGGFSVVAFDGLPQGLLILYCMCFINGNPAMTRQVYIYAFPVSTTISSTTNIARNWPTGPPQKVSHRSSLSRFPHARFVYEQVRSQFSHDIWWLSLAILVIAITESDHSEAEPLAFSAFRIIFEAVSAYSCVGVSIGYPGQTYSFCGAWHTLSKLLLIAVSLRGRHRGISVILANVDLFHKPRGITGEEKTGLEKHRHVIRRWLTAVNIWRS